MDADDCLSLSSPGEGARVPGMLNWTMVSGELYLVWKMPLILSRTTEGPAELVFGLPSFASVCSWPPLVSLSSWGGELMGMHPDQRSVGRVTHL